MRKLSSCILLSLLCAGVTQAASPGLYVVTDDLTIQILTDKTVSGTMLLKKGRQIQVTGQEGEFVQVELGKEIKGQFNRYQEIRIAPVTGSKERAVTPVQPPAVEAAQSTSALSESWEPKPPSALMIKGVYIGMLAEEAVRALNSTKSTPIKVTYTHTGTEYVGYKIDYGVTDQNGRVVDWRTGGELYASMKTRRVEVVRFWGELSDILFNTSDLSASAFAQRLIDSYRIPELKVVTLRGKSIWHYESRSGWSIYVSTDKTLELFLTPTRQFD